MRRYRIAAVSGCVIALAILLAVPQIRFLFLGFPEQRLDGRSVELGDAGGSQDADQAAVTQALAEAGLNGDSVLGDTGISGHLSRMEAGSVTAAALLAYAEGLRVLSERTRAEGREIPAAFWDGENDAMRADGWDSYRVVAALNKPEAAPYVTALSKAYARFHAFKTSDPSGGDTALDTALDLFEPVLEFLEDVPPEHLLERSDYIRSREQAAIYLWQRIIAGSTRVNPLTHIKIFDHGFTSRFHMGTIWQYDTGIAEGNSAIWGVSGFASDFVGPPENNNQVEHMSISIVVQGLLREPVLILEAFEEYERLSGHASAAESAADKALNAVIREKFLPGFEQDLPSAVQELRDSLRRP